MGQTTYLEKPVAAMPGMIADETPSTIVTAKFVDAAGAPFGIFVTKGANEGEVKLMTGGADPVAGILVHTHHVDVVPVPAGKDISQNDIMPLGQKGRFYALIEEDMAEDDPVYVRHTANGAGKLQVGAIRNDNDGANAVLLKGATIRRGGVLATDGVAVVDFDLAASRV